jgi:SAM-dependent methyltransferase
VFHRYVAPALARTHLARPAFRVYERLLALGERGEDAPDDGLPVPTAHLRVLVNGSPSRSDFLGSGHAAASSISACFADAGHDLARAEALLDFGCGCGRVARHWRGLDSVAVHGCDFNAELVDWTSANLPFVATRRNELAPPAPFADDRFEAIYAISVLTHLTEELHHAWLADLRRMLRPGGRLLFTTHGVGTTEALLPEERARFDRGELLVRFDGDAGSNLCSAFHPEAWVRGMIEPHLDVELFRPGGAPGLGAQDVWVARKPG